MTVRIRSAVDGDRPGICTVHVRAILETCSRSHSTEQTAAWAGLLSPDSCTAVLQKRIMIVAVEDATLIGFGQLDPQAGQVEAVYVLPERQVQGIGQTLLSELEHQALERGITALELSATMNATGFYRRAGYERRQVAVHRLPTGIGLRCIRMSKQLQGSQGDRASGSNFNFQCLISIWSDLQSLPDWSEFGRLGRPGPYRGMISYWPACSGPAIACERGKPQLAAVFA